MDRALKGGTDAGSMVVFDPAALPDEFDVRQSRNPISQLEDLMRAGRLYWLDPHADGSYTLGVYFGAALPERVKPFANTLGACDPLHIPSGRLFFSGVEYAFHTDDSLLRKYRHMGECAAVNPGLYRAEFFEFQYPEGFEETLLEGKLSPLQLRAFRCMNILAPAGCISVLGLVASLGLLHYSTWGLLAVACSFMLIALPILWSRLPAYRQAVAVQDEVEKEFPAYGVLLPSIAMAGTGDAQGHEPDREARSGGTTPPAAKPP
jgi:hypothetical protein